MGGSVSELELAAPWTKTLPNSPMALPVKACAVVPCSAKSFSATDMSLAEWMDSAHVTCR